MESTGGSLTGSLELASAFSTRISTGVPLEIVEAENQAEPGLPSENGAQNITAEDAMEISVEGDSQGPGPGLDSTQLSAAPKSVELPVASMSSAGGQAAGATGGGMMPPAINNNSTGDMVSVVAPPPPSDGRSVVGQLSIGVMTSSSSSATSVQPQSLLSSTNFSSASASSMLSSTQQNPHSSQLTRTVMEQLSDAQGLEISADAITSMSLPSGAGTLVGGGGGPTGTPSAGGSRGGGGGGGGGYSMSYSSTPNNNVSSLMASRGHRDLLSSNVSYSDLELSVGANASAIDAAGSVLNDPESPPSSPESNFDSSELLSNPLTQQDDMTQRLVQSGPVGVAAAAAIMSSSISSSRKRKRQHTFETNPSFRKRHCSKLTKKLKETIDELAARVGLQAVVVTFRPGKGSDKNEPSFKVFGAAPLANIVKNQRESIVSEMEAALHQQMPQAPTPPSTTQGGEPLFELPPLIFDGIPTPVHKMTQAQLRTFIPNMLKYSTGRGKPGWGKDDVRPPWWPDDVPWANVRSDVRSTEQKKALQWTDALRRIVINCYLHHGRMDLLPEFSLDLLQVYLTPQVAQQLQVQLSSLQQQPQDSSAAGGSGDISMGAMNADSAADEVAAALTEITEASGGVEGRDDPEMMVGGDNQQVFTVDTGIGNCDMAGMPTLADASLAETAARLQQLADESGEVQYATQTVTVTDRDAKALGQPVGSTTTVLLTAYPGGHSGAAANSAATAAAAAAAVTGGGAGGGGGGGATAAVATGGGSSVAAGGVGDVSTTSAAGGGSGGGGLNPSAVVDPAAGSQQYLTTSQPSQPQPGGSTGNVQVVYSASHVNPIPDSMSANPDLSGYASTTPSNNAPQGGGSGDVSSGSGGGGMSQAAADTGLSDYLNPTSSQEVMMPPPHHPHHANASVVGGGASGGSEPDTTNDLAAELIREYSLGADSMAAAERKQGQLTPMAAPGEEKTTTQSPES